MMRSITTWLRVVLPPERTILLFLLFYSVHEGIYVWLVWWERLPVADQAVTTLLSARIAILAIALVMYGGYRVLAFHPCYRPAYHCWLALTPWRRGKTLPLGPIHLSLQDVVVFAAAVLLALSHEPEPKLVLVLAGAMLGTYLLMMLATFLKTGVVWTGYVLAFGIPLAVLWLAIAPTYFLVVLGLLYGLAHARIPVSMPEYATIEENSGKHQPEFRVFDASAKAEVGWAYSQLEPKPMKRHVSYRDGIVPILLGWWVYVGLTLCQMSANLLLAELVEKLWNVYFCVVVLCAAVRLVSYCWNHRPPISLEGRILTLRWIIPGYDVVFIAPLCTLLVGYAAPAKLSAAGIDAVFAMPISLSLVLLTALNVAPTTESWRLTGFHRIAPGPVNRTAFIEI